jgi:hypothetical protein
MVPVIVPVTIPWAEAVCGCDMRRLAMNSRRREPLRKNIFMEIASFSGMWDKDDKNRSHRNFSCPHGNVYQVPILLTNWTCCGGPLRIRRLWYSRYQ